MEFTHKILEKLDKSGRHQRKQLSPLVTSEDTNNRVIISDGKAIFTRSLDQLSGQDYSCSYDSLMAHQDSQSRQRMRPWLEARINSGEIPGLEWVDKNRQIFKVPWKRFCNREWKEDDSQIFKEWAVHTGRYTHGSDSPDYPTWKTRFRNALNKLPDIQELKEQNQLDGNEPFRIYQLLQRNGLPQEVTNAQPAYEASAVPDRVIGVPSTIADEDSVDGRLASDLDRINTDDLISCSSSEIRNVRDAMDTTSGGFENAIQSMEVQSISNSSSQRCLEINPETINNSRIYLTLKYRTTTIFEKEILNMHGCRIYHGQHDSLTHEFEEIGDFTECMFGPRHAEPIMLPECSSSNSRQKKLTDELLNAADRGVHFSVDGGNIVAVRKCRCSVFVSSKSLNDGQTTKLKRDEATVVYDFHKYFLPNLEKYIHGTGPKPSAEVTIGFGQRFLPERESVSNLLISGSLVHTEAYHLITTITCSDPLSPPVEISYSDDYDKFLKNWKFTTQLQENNGDF